MNDPIKVIHKYKNNNGRIQYHINIFLGDICNKKCMAVLDKIKNMNLFSALTEIPQSDIDILIKRYGEYWYEKFFNNYHINYIKETTYKNASKMKNLRDRYGKDWIDLHFVNYRKHLETITYSYEAKMKQLIERANMDRTIKQKFREEIEEMGDYTTMKNKEIVPELMAQSPVEEVPEIETPQLTSDFSDTLSTISELTDSDISVDGFHQNIDVSSDISDEGMIGGISGQFDDYSPSEPSEEEFESEVDALFSQFDETDPNAIITTNDIKTVLSNSEYNKIYNQILDFDRSKDSNMFDEKLSDVYQKNYILHQYIYKDDTVKTIKKKITAGFKNNDKFGNNTYIVPSYQYLWSEYYLKGVVKKVMIGEKWIVKNDLIKIDIEPISNLGIYEDLRGDLKTLRDDMKRQGKIKRDDDEQNVFYDYEGYYTCNEIFLIDIYNELGLDYNPSFEEIRNLLDIFIKIYFNKISPDSFNNILKFLKKETPENEKNIERNKNKKIYENINNDLILENEIMKDIELTKEKDQKIYPNYFKETNIMHSVSRAYISDKYEKIDLFRIFDNFVLSMHFPFIQFQPLNDAPRARFYKNFLAKTKRKDAVMKWFENSPYGINFKVNTNYDKPDLPEEFVSIGINDNGRLDYQIQWKEEYGRTIHDIKKSYELVRTLIKKINAENSKSRTKLTVPADDQFRFAFITTIQKIELPGNLMIDHDDLSTFATNFYPYVAVVVEPRKRESTLSKDRGEGISKFGTYLRYKRISKYENKARIEHRIIFFMRNYEYNDAALAKVISNDFNITEEQALLDIAATHAKYIHLRKSRKVLKKLENIPKYKSPGIIIEIQGKMRDKYKLRIAGAHDEGQLNRITEFMNIMIYLYLDTYLFKNPARQKMVDRITRLTNIARRRNKVGQIFQEIEPATRNIKQMVKLDSQRLKKKGLVTRHWSKECQQSGEKTRRRPQQYFEADELINRGYILQKKTDDIPFDHWIKKVLVDDKGRITKNKKGKEVILRAVKLALDESGENNVFYTCNPDDNGEHINIGFLGKDDNAAPCCFIKDHIMSKNPKKRNLFLKSVGIIPEETSEETTIEQSYILQDNVVIEENRFAFLPKYLDILMNIMLGKEREIVNHRLIKSVGGYHFKYGVKRLEQIDPYFTAISSIFNMTVKQIKENMISALESDKGNIIFTSLNNGDVIKQFRNIESYKNYIKSDDFLDYTLMNDLITLPGVIRKNGVFIVFFQTKRKVIQKKLEKEVVVINYYIDCLNSENVSDIKDPAREVGIIIHEQNRFYPVVHATKKSDSSTIIIDKTFHYEESESNIIHHIYDYYKLNCLSDFNVLIGEKDDSNNISKNTYKILLQSKNKDYHPKYQYVDSRYKCKYIITQGGFIVSTAVSGAIYNLSIVRSIDKYIKDHLITAEYLNAIDKDTNSILKLKMIGYYYSDKKNDGYIINRIMTEGYGSVPVNKITLSKDYIKKNNLIVTYKTDYNVIDQEIAKGPDNIVIDQRIIEVSKYRNINELYQLFRLHLSYFLNHTVYGKTQLKKLVDIINGKNNRSDKKIKIKKILYKTIDSGLSNKFNALISQRGGFEEDKKWIHLQAEGKKTDYALMKFSNNRELCYDANDKNKCHALSYCYWNNSKNMCVLDLKKEHLIDYVNRVAEELVQNDIGAQEILNIDDHYVADVVNYNVYQERPEEGIVVGSSKRTAKILDEFFGKANAPIMGKKRNMVDLFQDYDNLNKINPLKESDEWFIQNIMEHNNTVFRAFANGYFWLLHPYETSEYRNLGYYSLLQTELSNIYKSQIIDWLRDKTNLAKIKSMEKYFGSRKDDTLDSFIVNLSTSIKSITSGIIELYVLSILYDVAIIVHDQNYEIIFDSRKENKISGEEIHIRFIHSSNNAVPDKMEIMYPRI